jgi:hypothetical protein
MSPWAGTCRRRVAQPDHDRGDVDGALVDDLAFVVPGGHRPELLEFAEAAFDHFDEVYAARTHGELAPITGDLPAMPPVRAPSRTRRVMLGHQFVSQWR